MVRKLVVGGYGGGVMVAGWGCTHHATEEMGLMRLIPEMTVLIPADAEETARATRAAAQETSLLVTLEEHTIIGGLGGAVAEVLAEAGTGTPLRRLGLPDIFARFVGSYEECKQRFGLTAEAVVNTVLRELGLPVDSA